MFTKDLNEQVYGLILQYLQKNENKRVKDNKNITKKFENPEYQRDNKVIYFHSLNLDREGTLFKISST